MPQAKSLTRSIMAKRTPFIIERDYPNSSLDPADPDYQECTCCFCGQRFLEGNTKWRKRWEHLDNEEKNEELWNLAWAHHYCNEKKRYDADLQILAREIIKKNQAWEESFDFESAREGERAGKFSQHKETSDEADVAAILYKHSVQLLAAELLPQDGKPPKRDSISLKEAAECVDYLSKKDCGRGSQSAAQRHLETLSCTISKEFERRIVDGKSIIFRRTGN